MKDIIVHTMEYTGDLVDEAIKLKPYTDNYFAEYKEIYNECFREMRIALEIQPIDCCSSREKLMQRQGSVFLLTKDQKLIASVTMYDHEIDDLIVAKQYQGKGYGKLLLKFAIKYMQEREKAPITLHVADWNKRAMALYLNNGFSMVKTETIKH